MKRHELTDHQWELLAPFFPRRPIKRGGQWKDDRLMLNGILWRLNTGAGWRDLPERFGPWQTVYDRFSNLRGSGRLGRIIERLAWGLNGGGCMGPVRFWRAGATTRGSWGGGG